MKKNHPLSMCTCGHIGDGDHSDHHDTFNAGHGKCRKCDCEQFSWQRYLTPAEEQQFLTESLIESLREWRRR